MNGIQELPLTVLGCAMGVALLVVGAGIRVAYGRKPAPRADGSMPPEMLVALFARFARVGTLCLATGAGLLAAAILSGPGLPVAVSKPVPITLYYAAALGLLLVILTYNVLRHRVRSLLESGNRDDPLAARIARVHGNFIEYAPLGLLLILALEWSGAPAPLVHFGGAVFTLARYAHAWGYTHTEGISIARIVGIQGTLFALAYMVALAAFQFAGN